MHERLVLCGGAERKGRQSGEKLHLRLTGSQPNINLRLHDISRRMIANVPDLLTDLIEIATYVLCADEAVSRGGDVRDALGTTWRRRFQFVIPVRTPDHWSSPEVTDALTDLLAFLSDDDYSFEFTKQSKPASFQSYLDFGSTGPSAFEADEVVLFSGGLDSLAGAIEELGSHGNRVTLVSHQSSAKMYDRQCYLAGELAKRFPGQVLHIPVRVTKQNSLQTGEYTQRTRAFLFASLAAAVASITGRDRIRFYENGIVSFNLPIAGQLVGTQATRTTHPRVIGDLARFLSVLLDQDFAVENPFVWKTKSQVAELIGWSDHIDLARYSVSCSRVRSMTKLHPHCGTCFQCIDRRFAALAADLGDNDPRDMYRVDLLTGAREEGFDRTMAEAYVRRGLEFRRMTQTGFLSQCIGQVSRGLSAFPGTSPEQVATWTFELHKRHGDSVHSVLTGAVRSYASDLVSGTLPQSCILRMAVGVQGGDFDDTPIESPSPAIQPDAIEQGMSDYEQSSGVVLALDDAKQQILIEGLPGLAGRAHYALIRALLANFNADRQSGLTPERFRYTAASQLAAEVSTSEQTVRRQVSRLRAAIARLCKDHFGFPLRQDAVIETKDWRGYRINPGLRLAKLSETES
jgi:7-cyano-7-deazaguanine synthase in queuosine biosynthesis